MEGEDDIFTQVLKLSEENCSEPVQEVLLVLDVIEVVSIDSEKVTEMLSVRTILLKLSVVDEIEDTVGAVVSKLLDQKLSLSLGCPPSMLNAKKVFVK